MKANIIEGNIQKEFTSENRPKIIKKTQLGKKTVLNSNINKVIRGGKDDKLNLEPKNYIMREEEVIVIKNEPGLIKKKEKDNSSDFLMKTILKAFYLSRWKKQVKSLKYYSKRYNPQRMNFKKLINQISSVIKQHKSDYFNEIYENMKNLPMPKDVKHDINYGKLKIINKEVLMKKNTDKIKMWSENNYKKKIEGFKLLLLETIKKIKEEKKNFQQTDSNNNKVTNIQNYKQNQNNQFPSKEDNKVLDYNKENTNINNKNNLKDNIKSVKKYMNKYYYKNENNLEPKSNNIDQYNNQYYYNNYNNDQYIEKGEQGDLIENDYIEDQRINYPTIENNHPFDTDEYKYNNYIINNNYEINYQDNNIYEDNNKYEDNKIYEDYNIYEDNKIYKDNNIYEDNKIYEDYNVYEDNNIYDDKNIYEDNNKYEDNKIYEDYNIYEDNKIYEDNNKYEDNKVYEDNNIYEDKNIYEDNNKYEDYKIYEDNEKYGNYNNYDYYDYANLENDYIEDDYNNNGYKVNYEINKYNKDNQEQYNDKNYQHNYNDNNYYIDENEYKKKYRNYYDDNIYNYNNNTFDYQENNKYQKQYDFPKNNKNPEYTIDYIDNKPYDNIQYKEEDYFYERPNKRVETKRISYYKPYETISKNQNEFKYYTYNGNNAFVRDMFTIPKDINVQRPTINYNFKTSSINNEYQYNKDRTIPIYKTPSSFTIYKRGFPQKYDNNSFYISK